MYFRKEDPVKGVWKSGSKYFYCCLGTMMIVDFSGDIPIIIYKDIGKCIPDKDWAKVDIKEFGAIMDSVEDFEIRG